MKTWNTPELQELDIRLTANGDDEDYVEEEDSVVATFSLNKGHKPGGGKPGGGGSCGGDGGSTGGDGGNTGGDGGDTPENPLS